MPNIASLLKGEVTRIARKEAKAQTAALSDNARRHRREISELKRRVQGLEQALRLSLKRAQAEAEALPALSASSRQRFSAKGLASLRRRLDLSAAEFGRLVGASALTVYKWEQGKARPRARFQAALADVRGIGKKEAARRLLDAG